MKTLTIAAGLALLSAQAGAYDLKPAGATNCRPSLEQFVAHELGGGAKVTPGQPALRLYGEPVEVTWLSGTHEQIVLGVVDQQVCVVARRFVSGAVVSAR
jgi:hypothetical protein